MTAITVANLTSGSVTGDGIFDKLMAGMHAQLEREFLAGRIRAPEYSTVYLGGMETVLRASLEFVLQEQKVAPEVAILLANVQLAEKQVEKITAEITQAHAQTALINQQVINAQAQKLQIEAQTLLIEQQQANAIIEGTVLVAQECKLRAEFDFTTSNTLRSAAETTLLAQKNLTEKAQTTALGVDDNSVIGRQKLLYVAQTDGFKRDAEQKVLKVMVDSWSVRRSTDEGVPADAVNKLDDATIGRAVEKALTGVGA